MTRREHHPLLAVVLALASALGLIGLVKPFLEPAATAAAQTAEVSRAAARADEAPLLFALLLGCCLLAVIVGLETRRFDARLLAALGTLLGINAVLRLIPGPGGFNAIFLLPILCGYVLGPSFGFLLGSLSLVVSSVLANALGPWLPFQMLAAGWIGLISGWLPRPPWTSAERGLLALWGFCAGILYGFVVNLWFWPYLPLEHDGWESGLSLARGLVRYALFYLGTSLWWDLGRALGNAVLILTIGPAVLRLLRRFAARLRPAFASDQANFVE